MSYKLFTDKPETFELVPSNYENIQAVCRIMTMRSDIADEDMAYYAELGGIEPHETKGFQKIWKFPKRPLSRATWIAALLPVLFADAPAICNHETGKVTDKERFAKLDAEQARAGIDFFFGRFGESLHDVKNWNERDQTIQSLENLTSMLSRFRAGNDANTDGTG